jgi:transposase
MRPVFVHSLSPEERAELERTYRTTSDADTRTRCHAILLSAQGYRPPEIARLLFMAPMSVRRWIARYEEGGVSALISSPPPGRMPSWDEAFEWQLVDAAIADPRARGRSFDGWTAARMADYLAETTGVRLSDERVRVLLRQRGYTLRRGRAVPVGPRASPAAEA